MASRAARSMAKAKARLQRALKEGEVYEALQMYIALANRSARADAEQLLASGITELLKAKEDHSAAELAGEYVKVIKQMGDKTPQLIAKYLGMQGLFTEPLEHVTFLRHVQPIVPPSAAVRVSLDIAHELVHANKGELAQAELQRCEKVASADEEQFAVMFVAALLERTKDASAETTGAFVAGGVLGLLVRQPLAVVQDVFDKFVREHALTAGKAPPYGIRKLDFARQLLLTLARDAAPLLARLREACAQDIAELKDGNKNLNKIAADYYNVQQAPNMGNLFAGMMRSMMGGGPR